MVADPRNLESVGHALDILIYLAALGREAGVTEIADQFHIGKATAHRMVSTLKDRGFLEQNQETSKYRVGLRALEVGSAYLSQLELAQIAHPFMQEMVERTHEKTNMGVIDKQDGTLVYVKFLDPENAVRVYTKLGGRTYLHATALGKAMLSRMSWTDVLELVNKKGLCPVTGNTITDTDDLKRDLEETRLRGYSIDNEEHHPEVRCVAAPISNHFKETVAALSISGPSYRIPMDRIAELGKVVMEIANEISRRLGCL